MPNYQNGKIYCLRSHQTEDIYIGSTTQSLAVRKGGHARDYKSYLNEKRCYISSFELCKYNDCYIELIEMYPCNSREELYKREGEIIKEQKCVNMVVAGRTDHEYYIDNKEKIKTINKEYYKKNKEKMNTINKEYYENNKEKMNTINKEYYEKNKVILLTKCKQYRLDNKERIKEWKKTKITCECGAVVGQASCSQHRRSKKHQNYILNI